MIERACPSALLDPSDANNNRCGNAIDDSLRARLSKIRDRTLFTDDGVDGNSKFIPFNGRSNLER